MKTLQKLMMLSVLSALVVSCGEPSKEEGPAEKMGKQIDTMAEETKEKAKELKQDIEGRIQNHREDEELREYKETPAQEIEKKTASRQRRY